MGCNIKKTLSLKGVVLVSAFLLIVSHTNVLAQCDAGSDVTICIGDSVQLNASGGTGYKWSPSSSLNNDTLPDAWAKPTASTTYYLTVTGVSGELITNGDFEQGNIGFTSDYILPAYWYSTWGKNIPAEGQYGITTYTNGAPAYFHPNFAGCSDHTNPPTGLQMGVNGAPQLNKTVWRQTVTNVIPFKTYYFSTWVQSICNHDPAKLQFQINGALIGAVFTASTPAVCVWQNFYVTWFSGANTTADIAILNQVLVASGNDFALDDISFSTSTVCYDSVRVIVINPVANAGADKSVCLGNDTILTATGGGTYEWNTGETTASITVTPITNTTYTVTTSNYGCTATDEAVVTIDSSIADAGADTVICIGENVDLTATGGGTYVWSTNATTSTINVSPLVQTTYTVTVTNAGCTDVDAVVVRVDSTTANAGADVTICAGGSTNLTATGGGTYLWSTNETLDSITVSPVIVTTYTVTVTLNGCTDTDEVIVRIDSAIANAGPDNSICVGDNATLTASGGGTYQWSTNATTASITVSPVIATTYTVTVTSAGCTDVDEVVITVDSATAYAGLDTTICEGFNATLRATGTGTYEWSGTTAKTVSITVSPVVTTTYTVTITHAGCTATDEVVVTVNSATADAGSDVTICNGETVTLTASGGGTYIWYTGDSTSSITVTPVVTTTYTVSVTNTGCTDTDDVVVIVNPNPTLNINDVSICEGDSAIIDAGSGYKAYSWQDGSTNQTYVYTYDSSGVVWVEITDNNDCVGRDTVTITLNPNPVINLGEDTVICEGTIRVLDPGNYGGTYLWQDGSTKQTYTAITFGTYSVFVIDNNGCEGSDEIELKPCPPKIDFPNVFTPNGDGTNEEFERIIQENIVELELLIYNRWGRLVFESNNIEEKWDGTFNGKECSDGVYFWIANYKGADGTEGSQHGTVTLIR